MEPVLDQLGVELAQLFLGELRVPHEVRPARDVERDARQGLVHRREGAAVPADPALVAERIGDRLAERERAVLGGVMLVDMEIARDLQGHVDQRVAAELFDHVIEKADTGGDVVSPRSVEVYLGENVGFPGLAGYPAGAHGPPIGRSVPESITWKVAKSLDRV